MQHFQGIKHINAIPIQQVATNATATSNVIDTLGFSEMELCVFRETHTSGAFSALTIQQSDDTVAANFATVTGLVAGTDYTVGDAIGGTNTAVTNISFVANVDLRGKKRYFRLLVTPSVASAYVSAHALLGKGAVSAADSAAGVAELVNQPD
jgi:hypothetical protein